MKHCEVNVCLEHWLNIHLDVKNWWFKPQDSSLFLYFEYGIWIFSDGILATSFSVSYILQRKEVAKSSFAEDDEDAYGSEEVHSTGLSWPSRRFLHPEKVDSYSFCRTCSCDRSLSQHRQLMEFWQVLHVAFVGKNTTSGIEKKS